MQDSAPGPSGSDPQGRLLVPLYCLSDCSLVPRPASITLFCSLLLFHLSSCRLFLHCFVFLLVYPCFLTLYLSFVFVFPLREHCDLNILHANQIACVSTACFGSVFTHTLAEDAASWGSVPNCTSESVFFFLSITKANSFQ